MSILDEAGTRYDLQRGFTTLEELVEERDREARDNLAAAEAFACVASDIEAGAMQSDDIVNRYGRDLAEIHDEISSLFDEAGTQDDEVLDAKVDAILAELLKLADALTEHMTEWPGGDRAIRDVCQRWEIYP